MKPSAKIYVAGHRGLIGTALCRRLRAEGYDHLVTADHHALDLMDQASVARFFEKERPEYVFFVAGKVGGVYANDTYRAEFIYDNLLMQCHVLHQAYLHEVQRLIFFSCSSVYPKMCPQPMKEEYLLTGSLEPTSEPFAVAKIAGMKMCESYNRQYGTDFLSVIPTNIYGLHQNYEPMNCLVIPALVRKFHDAKQSNAARVTIWGTGRAARDFLFGDDLADAAVFLAREYASNEPINVGTGVDHTVRELAEIIRRVVGYRGEIAYDASKTDGALIKLQDVSRLSRLGWTPKVELEEGIRRVYADYVERVVNVSR